MAVMVVHHERPRHYSLDRPLVEWRLYHPPAMRWEGVHNQKQDIMHARGPWERTLCGLTTSGLAHYDNIWLLERDNACTDCRAMAVEIDARWPTNQRACNGESTGGCFIDACICHRRTCAHCTESPE